MKTKITSLMLAGLFGATIASQGAVIISGLAQFNWPSSTLLGGYEHTPVTDVGSAGVGVKDGRNFGQTFTIAENGTVDLIAFSFENFATSGSDFTVDFYKVASVGTGGTPTGPVDSGTFSAANVSAVGFSNGDAGTLVLDVTDTAVTAGDVYAWEITAGTTIIFTAMNLGSGYAGGESFGDVADGRDYFVGAYAAVPEPSSTALLGLGLSSLLLRRRRS